MKRPLLATLLALTITTAAQSRETPAVHEAAAAIARFNGDKKVPFRLKLIDKIDGKDQFRTSVRNGKLEIHGSSGVALCKGYYDYLKGQHAGISSWSGNRNALPSKLANTPERHVVSPVEHHYNFNVVTYGYTMPYWDWNRWEQEIDWMALHGVDMPLALVANEAISARVWKKLGLTDDEISQYFVGPAHLPWMRMGNISGLDSPMPTEWHEGQVRLQHKILDRMRALDMKPICPAFAGFVPQAIKRVFPDAKLTETQWGGAFKNWMLDPEQELFSRIGQMFIEEWEAEFGKGQYYLADSFNEMEIPFPAKGTPERYSLLASYGDRVYSSIKAGNPDAVWVMQGWMFGYQRNIWDYETLAALVSKVPDDKMLLLDLAADYSMIFWGNGANWEFYKGFYNKPWVYSVIPNMGGKTGLTGVLDFYANGHLAALNSPNRGQLTAIGMAPEGIENNELLYELLTDAGWSSDSIDVRRWLHDYSVNRYGSCPPQMDSAWSGLLESAYGTFTDHPRYNWQFRPGSVRKGSINASPEFFKAIEAFATAAPQLRNSELYGTDLAEMTAHYLGGKIELLAIAIDNAYLYGQQEQAAGLEQRFVQLMIGMDQLLETHPVLRLERWLDFARNSGDSDSLKNYYEKNARRIVTIWGPPVDDYSARIWSGLIRDYYLPRWQHYFASRKSGQAFDYSAWEQDWVENQTGLSAIQPYANPIDAAVALIDSARDITPDLLAAAAVVGTWTADELNPEVEKAFLWNIPAGQLQKLRGIRIKSLATEPGKTLTPGSLTLELDGRVIGPVTATDNLYTVRIPSDATGNNICRMTLRLRGNAPGQAILMVEPQ